MVVPVAGRVIHVGRPWEPLSAGVSRCPGSSTVPGCVGTSSGPAGVGTVPRTSTMPVMLAPEPVRIPRSFAVVKLELSSDPSGTTADGATSASAPPIWRRYSLSSTIAPAAKVSVALPDVGSYDTDAGFTGVSGAMSSPVAGSTSKSRYEVAFAADAWSSGSLRLK